MSQTYNPVSTYRIQFHSGFTLQSLEEIIPYLKQLGIRTVYASPVFEAVKGSMHGYDGTNPLRINPEIGTEAQLRNVSTKLHESGIGWLQDIVPNHMAFDPANAWLMDVLQLGPASAFASYFDIDWNAGQKLMVPVLGDTLEKEIARGQLRLVNNKGHYLEYGGACYPLKPGAYPEHPAAAALEEIAAAQHYRLCHWQETDRQINYRRFFTVNGLICLNIQDEAVFKHIHRFVATLVKDGVFDGLRIDHIDGLNDPTAYLEQLRALCGPEPYIVVEKILQPGESIPGRWPVAGTTGYDFLGLVNNLFTARRAKEPFTSAYRKLSGDLVSPSEQAFEKKARILEGHMQGELENLSLLAGGLLPELDAGRLLRALAALLIHFPVYRFYGNAVPLAPDEAAEISSLFSLLQQRVKDCRPELQRLETLLLDEPATASSERNLRIAHFYRRLMQFTGPLMAKGVEDTLMYTYSRFIAHNEVGDSPEAFGSSVEDFHQAMLQRQRHWPLTQNATSTHDTKRGEDSRALLNALTHAPAKWLAAVATWRRMNASLRNASGPDMRDEYFVYQTLFASYPLRGEETASYPDRLAEYLQKALREGKRRSDWVTPDEAYEQAVIRFARTIIQPGSAFLGAFNKLRGELLDGSLSLALSQLILKHTCPGVPDTYQGTEHWDLSLVDPDNRRAVAYAPREEALNALLRTGADWKHSWNSRIQAAPKLWLTASLLRLRSDNAGLFARGLYMPLRISGEHKDKAISFVRKLGQDWILVVVPIGLNAQGASLSGTDWERTYLELPKDAPEIWRSGSAAEPIRLTERVSLASLFSQHPFAILAGSQPVKERSAGILMAISSLPGKFGVGDLGPEARRFARSLGRAGQRLWQLLPLNPVSGEAGFSPYSSSSTMAGNTLLISPELLADLGLLNRRDLELYTMEAHDQVDYEAAIRNKEKLLDLAYVNYRNGGFRFLKARVEKFAEQESAWLQDLALYLVIKASQDGKPWYRWPQALRAPGSSDVQRFRDTHAGTVERIIWEQALFSMQWRELREYCNDLGLSLVGDLPFYLSYDSTDVWANQHLFSVDEQGRMTGVSGVPPDYFSETGQLWGMPTFNWPAHRGQAYSWWVNRLRRSLDLYDLLRIDHFRALAEYWEVSAGEETAVNGKWMPGPGTGFFDTMRKAFGELPFIAEDLGDNMEKVYALREETGLPGMKVMQFAFGENLPEAVDAPHNYTPNSICYTGTHDNNTTLGWFRKEAGADDRNRIGIYLQQQATEQNINDLMARLVYSSVSRRAILPMQDVLELDERARMNTPSRGEGNWGWRMRPDAFARGRQAYLLQLARLFNRY